MHAIQLKLACMHNISGVDSNFVSWSSGSESTLWSSTDTFNGLPWMTEVLVPDSLQAVLCVESGLHPLEIPSPLLSSEKQLAGLGGGARGGCCS